MKISTISLVLLYAITAIMTAGDAIARELEIGAEIGPLWVLRGTDPWAANGPARDADNFVAEQYFFPDMYNCGFRSAWSGLSETLSDNDLRQLPEIWTGLINDQNDPWRQWLQIRPVTYNNETISCYVGWRSETSIHWAVENEEEFELWDRLHFFPPDDWWNGWDGNGCRGNAMQNVNGSWYAQKLHDGFIIGRGDQGQNTNLDANWVMTPRHKAFMVFDQYTIAIKMAQLTNIDGDNQDICTFYVRGRNLENTADIVWSQTLTENDVPWLDEDWVEFDVQAKCGWMTLDKDRFSFALQWHGYPDEEEPQGKMVVSDIRYEGDLHDKSSLNKNDDLCCSS